MQLNLPAGFNVSPKRVDRSLTTLSPTGSPRRPRFAGPEAVIRHAKLTP